MFPKDMNGDAFVDTFFWKHHFGRFVSGIGQVTPRPWYFYPPVVLGDAFPLSLFLVPAAMLWWRTRERLQTLLWLWILTIVVFFSFSHDKQDLYIFPIVPAVAALGAIAIVRREELPRAIPVTTVVLGAVLALLGAAILYLFAGDGRVYAMSGAIFVGVVAMGGGLATAITRNVLVALLALVIVNWTFVLRVLPAFDQYKPSPKMSDFLRPRLQDGDRIAHFNVALPSMVFYLQHHIEPYYSADAFVEAMHRPGRVYGVITARDYEGMRDRLPPATCVLHQVPTFDVKLKNILARQPLPELLLLANRCP